MDDTNSRVIADAAPSFPSFIALRAKHSELLQRDPDAEDAKETCLKDVEHFIKQVQTTGAILSDDEERRSSQNILNYWVSALYRQDQVARLVTLADYNPKLTAQIADVLCPYPGVRAFTEQDSQFFFGRQRQIDYMVGRLKEDCLLVIVGASGSGKTSLVQAGLLPALKKEQPRDFTRFFFPPIVPGSDPLMSLALMIKRAKNSTEDDPHWLRQQVEGFQQDEGHLLKLVQEITDNPAVIFIDQGEELYERSVHMLLRPLENVLDLDNSKKTIEPFLDNLVRVVQSPDRKHIVIIARRIGDYEPHFKRLPSRVKEVFEPARVVLPAVNASELRDAIEKPAELLGVKFEEGVPQGPDESESSLGIRPKETTVQALVKEISSEPAGLPLLQFTLPRLWEKRDGNKIPDQAFREIGSCRVALSNTAEEFFKNLDYLDQLACRRVLRQLVRLDSELKPHVYPVRRASLYRSTEKQSRVDNLIEKMGQKQLVRISKGEKPADDEIELVHASLISSWPRMISWIEGKRRIRWVSRIAAVLGVVAISVLGGFVGSREIGKRLERAKSRDLAQRSKKQFASNHFDRALLFGLGAYHTEDNEETRGNLLKLLYSLQFTPQAEKFLPLDNFDVADLAFTTEQHQEPSRLAAIDREGKIVIWDLNWNTSKSPKIETTLSSASQASYLLSFSPDSKTLATGSDDPSFSIILWDLASGEPNKLSFAKERKPAMDQAFVSEEPPILGLAYKPDGKHLFTGGQDGSVMQWDLRNPEDIKATTLFKHTTQVNSVTLSADGSLLVVGTGDGAVILYDLLARRVRSKLLPLCWETVAAGPVYNVVFSPDNKLLAASWIDGATIWNLSTTKVVQEFRTYPTGLFVSFSADNHFLQGYSTDGNISVWEVATGVPVGRQSYKSADPSKSVSFSSNGMLMALPSGDGLIVYEVFNRRAILSEVGINSIAFAPLKNTLAIAAGTRITAWEAQSVDHRRELFGENQNPADPEGGSDVVSLAYSSDGGKLAAGSKDGTISLRDPVTLKETHVLKPAPPERPEQQVARALTNVVFDPDDSRTLAAVYSLASDHPPPEGSAIADSNPRLTSEIILWNTATSEQMDRIPVSGEVTSIAFHPNGQLLAWATTNASSNVTLWDSVAKKQSSVRNKSLSGVTIEPQVTSLAWYASPDRDEPILAVGWNNGAIELWDGDNLAIDRNNAIIEAERISLLEGPIGEVAHLAFSPDRKTLATVTNKSDAGTIVLWDIDTGEQLVELKVPDAPISSIAFRYDGRILASGSLNRSVVLWDVDVEGAGTHFCVIIDCRARYEVEEMKKYLDDETLFQQLYRRTAGRTSLREKILR